MTPSTENRLDETAERAGLARTIVLAISFTGKQSMVALTPVTCGVVGFGFNDAYDLAAGSSTRHRDVGTIFIFGLEDMCTRCNYDTL